MSNFFDFNFDNNGLGKIVFASGVGNTNPFNGAILPDPSWGSHNSLQWDMRSVGAGPITWNLGQCGDMSVWNTDSSFVIAVMRITNDAGALNVGSTGYIVIYYLLAGGFPPNLNTGGFSDTTAELNGNWTFQPLGNTQTYINGPFATLTSRPVIIDHNKLTVLPINKLTLADSTGQARPNIQGCFPAHLRG